jgi:hypothetical protein
MRSPAPGRSGPVCDCRDCCRCGAHSGARGRGGAGAGAAAWPVCPLPVCLCFASGCITTAVRHCFIYIRSNACAAVLAAILNVPCERSTSDALPFAALSSVGVVRVVSACADMLGAGVMAAEASSLILSCLCQLAKCGGVSVLQNYFGIRNPRGFEMDEASSSSISTITTLYFYSRIAHVKGDH